MRRNMSTACRIICGDGDVLDFWTAMEMIPCPSYVMGQFEAFTGVATAIDGRK